MGRFDGRVAVVTGAGSGLGRATARQLASEGAAVACLDIADRRGREDRGRDRRAGRHGPGLPGRRLGSRVGASARWTAAAPRPRAAAAGGQLRRHRRFSHTHEMPFDEWQRIIGVNLTGTFLVCQAALPYLLDGGGSIVNIASNAGIMVQPYRAAYCASKGGVVNLTRALADEYLKRGVRVNCVAPGGIETPLQDEFTEMPEGVDWKEIRKVMSPLGNSQPEEIANIVVVRRVRRVPLHDRLDRLGRRRHHDMKSRESRTLMIDDARSVWELIERRAAATPDRVMLYDGDRDHDVRAVPRPASARGRGSARARCGRGYERVVAAPDVDGVGGARRRAVPASARSRTRCCRSTATARSRSSPSRRTASCSSRRRCGTTSTTPRSPSRSRARTTACTRSSPITGTPRATRRRFRRRPRCIDDPAADPVRWIFYTSGTTADAEGRAAHRPLGARRRDRLRGEDARGRRRHRARRVPVHARRRHHHRRVHAAAHRLGRGAHGGVDAAGVDRADPQARVTLANGAAAIHAALIAEAKADPDAYTTVRDFPSGGSARPPQLHDELKAVVPSSSSARPRATA